jgi:hypothetical protein
MVFGEGLAAATAGAIDLPYWSVDRRLFREPLRLLRDRSSASVGGGRLELACREETASLTAQALLADISGQVVLRND